MEDESIINVLVPIIGVIIFLCLFGGCSSNKKESEYQLLHIEDYHAKKNIDIKDIIKKDTC